MSYLILAALSVVGFLGLRQMIVPALSPRPDNLGVKNGQLAPCPNSPNCVSSQADPSDTLHYVEPLTFKGTKTATHSALLNILKDMGGTIITAQPDDYIYTEFKSALMNYTDDLEIYLDDNSDTVHIRSAARLGYGDMGINRKRVEAIRDAYRQ